MLPSLKANNVPYCRTWLEGHDQGLHQISPSGQACFLWKNPIEEPREQELRPSDGTSASRTL